MFTLYVNGQSKSRNGQLMDKPFFIYFFNLFLLQIFHQILLFLNKPRTKFFARIRLLRVTILFLKFCIRFIYFFVSYRIIITVKYTVASVLSIANFYLFLHLTFRSFSITRKYAAQATRK